MAAVDSAAEWVAVFTADLAAAGSMEGWLAADNLVSLLLPAWAGPSGPAFFCGWAMGIGGVEGRFLAGAARFGEPVGKG